MRPHIGSSQPNCHRHNLSQTFYFGKRIGPRCKKLFINGTFLGYGVISFINNEDRGFHSDIFLPIISNLIQIMVKIMAYA